MSETKQHKNNSSKKNKLRLASRLRDNLLRRKELKRATEDAKKETKKEKNLSSIFYLIPLILLSACATETYNHGYTFEQSDFSSIKVKHSSVADVLTELGSPTSQSNFGEKVFYYISYKSEKVAFFEPKVIEQRVLAISFSDERLVSKITEYALDDRNQVAFSEDKTEIHGNSLSPIEQVMSNIGKYNKKK